MGDGRTSLRYDLKDEKWNTDQNLLLLGAFLEGSEMF